MYEVKNDEKLAEHGFDERGHACAKLYRNKLQIRRVTEGTQRQLTYEERGMRMHY